MEIPGVAQAARRVDRLNPLKVVVPMVRGAVAALGVAPAKETAARARIGITIFALRTVKYMEPAAQLIPGIPEPQLRVVEGAVGAVILARRVLQQAVVVGEVKGLAETPETREVPAMRALRATPETPVLPEALLACL